VRAISHLPETARDIAPRSSYPGIMALQSGDKAPEFDKPTHDGEQISLAKLRGDKTVVLYFYPKDETPGCTAEACTFRDAYEDFVDAGAIVIGVSQDSLSNHEAFAAHHRLPFKLISDEDGKLRKAYQVPANMFGLIPGRVTYVIDRQGVIRHVFNSQIQPKRHVDEALKVVRTISS
jgi:peroxiredoxin Q/BCP